MYHVDTMGERDIPQAAALWRELYRLSRGGAALPGTWDGDDGALEEYLAGRIQARTSLVAREGRRIAGYLSWMDISFHQENSAFCPITGHAASGEDREHVYRRLYDAAASLWVGHGRFNHLWMIFHGDLALRAMLYDLGFGSYVIDAYRGVPETARGFDHHFRISRATAGDAAAVCDLVEESREYYGAAPIFLKRCAYREDELARIIEQAAVFVAWSGSTAIGLISVSMNARTSLESLAGIGCGTIDTLGAYVRDGHRQTGAGTCLLEAVLGYCRTHAIRGLHVSFETANPLANRFWRKHFTPVVLSVRRAVNRDAAVAIPP